MLNADSVEIAHTESVRTREAEWLVVAASSVGLFLHFGSLLVNASMQSPRSEFYEPFSGITYNNSAKTYTTINAPGRYYIAIFDEAGKRGDYVLATGELESFSIWDMPGVIWKVIQLRLGWLDHSKEVSGL